MGIKNYSTKVSEMRTVGEIQGLLALAGADEVRVIYKDRLPSSVSFSLFVQQKRMTFILPADVNGVLRSMDSDNSVPSRFKTEEQARRVAWRIVRDWVDAQLAFIEAKQAGLAQLFLAHAITDDGDTVYQKMLSSPVFLSSGDKK